MPHILRLRRVFTAISPLHWHVSSSSLSCLSRVLFSHPPQSLVHQKSYCNVRFAFSPPSFRSFSLLDASTDVLAHITAVETMELTEEQRESLVIRLKARCNALYNDNEAYVAPSEALSMWFNEIKALQCQYKSMKISDEVVRAYESGVAIASKQHQFALATALTKQMQDLGIRPTEKTYQYLIRNVALQLLSRQNGVKHTPVNDLRELLKDVTDDMWEREVISVVEREKRPLQLKTEKEFNLFHTRLIAGVETQLDEYEEIIKMEDNKEARRKKSTGPYNEALRVYADNNVKFSRMLQLMVTRDVVMDVETYETLLLGARWNEIPATVSQLLYSKLAHELTMSASTTASEHVCILWANAMKAIVYSSAERFNSVSASVYKRDIDQLRKVFVYVDKQLSSAFPKFSFATTMQYDEVYTMRAKAAAACGLIASMKQILNEYVECAPFASGAEKPVLSKKPFLSALEIFPWSLVDVLVLSREDALARAMSPSVLNSPRVLELRYMYKRVMRKLSMAEKTLMKIQLKLDSKDGKLNDDELRELLAKRNMANMDVEQESRRAAILERRLENASVVKANQVLINESLTRADNVVDFVLHKLLDAGYDVENDLDVSIKLMEQYMNSARRLDKRLAQRQKHVSPHMMYRIFKLVKSISGAVQYGVFDLHDPKTHEQLTTFFEYAVCAAVRFWREEETAALVRQQQRVLGTQQLTQREYDQLIFQRVTSLDISGAHSLLQEMHNVGMKPSQEAIHCIALGLLHRHNALPNDKPLTSFLEERNGLDAECQDEADQENEDEDPTVAAEAAMDLELSELLNVSDQEAIEKELELSGTLQLEGDDDKRSAKTAAAAQTLLLGSDAPVTVEDLVGFLQDWYNLYGVEPLGKTVVPIFAHLLDTNNLPELRRLLQIVQSMKGGLTPATKLWLERRISQLGDKTLDNFWLTMVN